MTFAESPFWPQAVEGPKSTVANTLFKNLSGNILYIFLGFLGNNCLNLERKVNSPEIINQYPKNSNYNSSK